MGLIFFVLVLFAAAILFPEGTKAFVVFAFKATAVVAVVGVALGAVMLMVGGVIHKSAAEVPKLEKVGHLTHYPSRIITLNDGTEIPTIGGWFNPDGLLIEEDK